MALIKSSRLRLKKLLIKAALICFAGLGYAFFIRTFHVSIPCPVYAVTGFYCPGCGVSRVCMALLDGNFLEAMHYNAGILAAAPVAAVVFLPLMIRYVYTGDARMRRWQNILLWGMIAWLLIFGILRNFPAFSFLAP